MICPVCKKDLEMCDCVIEGLSAKARAEVAHEEWLKRWGPSETVPSKPPDNVVAFDANRPRKRFRL